MYLVMTPHNKDADIDRAKEFAIAFVISVTEPVAEASDDPQNWIAKNGKDSIFEILLEICPEVIRLIICVNDASLLFSKPIKNKTGKYIKSLGNDL
jgi:hypothetical protein